MIVKAVRNDESKIPREYLTYALPWRKQENTDSATIAVSIGKHYAVYALRQDGQSGTVWYLVYHDYDHLWWMPAPIYEVVDDSQPRGWVNENVRGDIFSSYPSLQRWEIEEGIIDGEEPATSTYLAEAQNDPSFPTRQHLDKLNEEFEKKQRMDKYNEDLRLAKERGWELPEKPE